MAEWTATFQATFAESDSFNISFADSGNTFIPDFGEVIEVERSYDPFIGPYYVTPGYETQTLETKRKVMEHNVIIAPIPQNYGLITWNGSTLTVS